MKTTATASNGTILEIGKKYGLFEYTKGTYVEVLAIGKNKVFLRTNNGYEITQDINQDWLPYEEPQPKPFEGYQKWYCINKLTNVIHVNYFKIEPKEDVTYA